MVPSSSDTNLFLRINHFAQRTSWLQSSMKLMANEGIVLFALLLVLGWLYARRQDAKKMAAMLWAGVGTLIAVGINQPVIKHFHETRPYVNLQHILVLAHRGADYSFPSDHATMAGAATAGLFLINPLLGIVSLVLALVLSFSRVYIGAHYPYDVLAGLALGAAVVLGGYLVIRKPLVLVITKLMNTPLRPLLTSKSASLEE